MKKSIIVISDYIEGQPVVASVRYAGIMQCFADKYTLLTINDQRFGTGKTQFSDENFKFNTPNSVFTQNLQGDDVPSGRKRGSLERLLRHKWIISIWRNYKLSKHVFNQKNKSLFLQLERYLIEHEVAAVFVTVPDIYALYILDFIKHTRSHIPAIIEIRDIINHDIGEGNPKFSFKRAERLVCKHADGVIAVSQGIEQYYRNMDPTLDIKLVMNGYDEQHFSECTYSLNPTTEQHLTLAHIGSIYKGRNIAEFIEGLLLFSKRTGIHITFNIVGLLDQQALYDIHNLERSGEGVTIQIIGSVEHHMAVEWLKSADIAVILTHVKGSDYAIPGKTFEYIGACKPMIAVTEDRELIALVHGKYGECARHERQDISDRLSSILVKKYDYSDRKRYSRATQAEQLLHIMEQKMVKSNNNMQIVKEV